MDFDAERIEERLMQITKISGSAASAEAVLSAIGALNEALSPMIGQRGVAALYARSTHIARRSHRWLPTDSECSLDDLNPLRSALAEQTEVEQARAGAAILSAFNAVLISLIGAPLAARILGRVVLPTTDISPTPDETP